MMCIRQWAVADSYATERSITPRLVYIASLVSIKEWLDFLRLRTLACFLYGDACTWNGYVHPRWLDGHLSAVGPVIPPTVAPLATPGLY